MSESKLIREALKQIFEADAGEVEIDAKTGKGILTDPKGERRRYAANGTMTDSSGEEQARIGLGNQYPTASAGPGRGFGPQGPRNELQRKEAEIPNRVGSAAASSTSNSRGLGTGKVGAQIDRAQAAQADMQQKAREAQQARADRVADKKPLINIPPRDSVVGGFRTSLQHKPNNVATSTNDAPDRGDSPSETARSSLKPGNSAATSSSAATSDEKAETPKPAASHKVQKGENLWNIIKQRGKTAGKTMSNTDIANEVKRLAQLNKMEDPNKIMPGDEIKFEETEMTISKSLIDAFDKIIASKHPNVFQEAKKKTAKEKQLAALAEPKDKITHKDVLVGRGVFKEEIESIFSEAELAYFEGVGKIAGKPNDKSVPAGKDTSNATGSRSGTLSDEYVEEGRRGRPPKGESLGANELHMNAKRAADNMDNVTHTFANGQKVKMTKAMGVGFLSRHRAAKTNDDKDDILNHAHSSLSAFKDVVEGKPIPKKKKKGISLAGNM
jgi:hypothetical protein